LSGPKGCGKTYTLAATFAVCHLKEMPCLFLAEGSFDNSIPCNNYLKGFVNNYAALTTTSHTQALYHLNNNEPVSAVETILEEISADTKQKKEMLLFADLSCMRMTQSSNLIKLLATYINDIRMIVSISSGARHSKNAWFNLIHQNCTSINIIRFTEKEARSFLKRKGVVLELEEVMHLTGTNPLLLSQMCDTDSLSSFESTLKGFVQNALEKNLPNLVNNITTLEQYLLHKDVLKCMPIIKLANRGHVLKEQEKKTYYDSLLWRHLLLVEEDSEVEDTDREREMGEAEASVGGSETDNDTDRKREIGEASAGGSKPDKVLLWNFPILTNIFIDILENFLTQSTDQQLQVCCAETPSFAGFWYEHLFFKHCKNLHSMLAVTIQVYYQPVFG